MAKNFIYYLFSSISIPVIFSSILFAQSGNSPYYIDPNRGQHLYHKVGIIEANQVQSAYENTGIFGSRIQQYWSISGTWPKGTGHNHIDGMTILCESEVTGTDGRTYHVLSQSYDDNPGGTSMIAPDGHRYEWESLPGYSNDHRHFVRPDGTLDTTLFIAHSADPTTWPSSWPGKDATWDGTWNGYFGKNQFNADDEGYYVMDDSWCNRYPYFPFPNDTTKGGLGLQTETRLFAWANTLAQDQVFIHFRITDISPSSYTRFMNNKPIFFGAFADVNPGGLGSVSDVDSYRRDQNMVETYSYNNFLEPGLPYRNILPGWMAWKFVESPGISDDGIDNDNDGMVDESRDNPAETWATYPQYHGPIYEASSPYASKIDSLYHIPPVPDGGVKAAFIATHDTSKFLKFFRLASIDQLPAIRDKLWWPGDENGNWDPALDDVGRDGISKNDPNYTGSDADGSEGDLRPEQGEPDFGILDKDESDQIGLTSFSAPTYGSVDPANEDEIWANIQPGIFSNPRGNENLLWIFSSGPFDLNSMQTERFSTVWVFGADETSILRSAITSQTIYNYNYRFTKPPIQPIVHAVAGDHKVTLYWDNRAEQSFNPIYGYNFEGYMVVRGTDPQLSEAQVITDALGDQTYYKPIAQFDLKDGIVGVSPVASGAELGSSYSKGIEFYLGDDSGLQHSFTDSSVTNGVTYYYAVLSYDRGYFAGMDTILNDHGFSYITGGVDRGLGDFEPSICPFSFTFDFNGRLTNKSQNTAVVIPNPQATNYVPGHTDADALGFVKQITGSPTTGRVQVQTVNPSAISTGNKYQITFTDSVNNNYADHTVRYSVKDLTRDSVIANTTIPPDSTGNASQDWSTSIFDGMYLNFYNVKPNLDSINANSGWAIGSHANIIANIAQGGSELVPLNFTIRITNTPASNPVNLTGSPTEYFSITNTFTGDTVQYIFLDVNKDNRLDSSDVLRIMNKTSSGYTTLWVLKFSSPQGVAGIGPVPGDEYDFVCATPFSQSDVFQYNTFADSTKSVPSNVLNRISVVPNPYIVAAKWELPTTQQGRGIQKIQFEHLPAKCTIRIFTQNGVLIKTLYHEGNLTDGTEAWDLTTVDGLNVAFGVYIYNVDAPGIGQKTGLFAVIQ